MKRMSSGGLALCLALVLPMAVFAQPEWVLTINPDAYYSSTTDAIYTTDGRLFLSTVADSTPLGSCKLTEVGTIGDTIGSTVIGMPKWHTKNAYFLGQAPGGELLVGTEILKMNTGAPEDSSTMCLMVANTDLQQLAAIPVGVRGRYILTSTGFLAPDGYIYLVYGVNPWESGPWQQFNLEALKIAPDGTQVAARQLLQGANWGLRAMSLGMMPDGHLLLAVDNANFNGQAMGGRPAYVFMDPQTLEVDTALNVLLVNLGPLTPTPNDTNMYYYPGSPLQALPLPTGHFISSAPTDEMGYGPLIVQRLDRNAQPVGHIFLHGTDHLNGPAYRRAMDLAPDGTFYIAWSNKYHLFPSQSLTELHITHMDTLFNVIGDYMFDGMADTTYRGAFTVRAAPDGGVVVTGQTWHNWTGKVRGWAAKLGPESFTAGVGEQRQDRGVLYPNPGSTGFRLHLQQGVPGGSLLLHDAQGRQVLKQPLGGTEASVHVPGLAPGLYLATVVNSQGVPLHTMRWSKVE